LKIWPISEIEAAAATTLSRSALDRERAGLAVEAEGEAGAQRHEIDAQQADDADLARDRVPIGGDQGDQPAGRQDSEHEGEDGEDRPRRVGLVLRRNRIGGVAADQAGLGPAFEVGEQPLAISRRSEHLLLPAYTPGSFLSRDSSLHHATLAHIRSEMQWEKPHRTLARPAL
jgi:hypothetical protein